MGNALTQHYQSLCIYLDGKFEDLDDRWTDRSEKTESNWKLRFEKLETRLDTTQRVEAHNKALAESLAAFHADLRNGTLRYCNSPPAKE